MSLVSPLTRLAGGRHIAHKHKHQTYNYMATEKETLELLVWRCEFVALALDRCRWKSRFMKNE